MRVRIASTLLLLVAPAMTTPIHAASLAECGLEYVLPPPSSTNDPVVLTLRGIRDYCSTVRVAAVGDSDTLGFSRTPLGFYDVILATRPVTPPPGFNCPSALVPFELTVRMPTLLPAVPVPGIVDIPVFMRYENADGQVHTFLPCGAIAWGGTEEGYRRKLHFEQGRFQATSTWRTAAGTGDGFAVPAETVASDSAKFWFFDPKNWEVMLKVLDGCSNNGHYWVIGAAATDVEFTLRVTDTTNGHVWERTSPGGELSRAFADVNAFPCGP